MHTHKKRFTCTHTLDKKSSFHCYLWPQTQLLAGENVLLALDEILFLGFFLAFLDVTLAAT